MLKESFESYDTFSSDAVIINLKECKTRKGMRYNFRELNSWKLSIHFHLKRFSASFGLPRKVLHAR